jgi:curved DNA-binding protein CbpA
MASFLIAILDIVLTFLESCFKENAQQPDLSGANCPNSTYGRDRYANKACTELDAAYDLFEMKRGEARFVDVKKNYKRLSLLHHPDRSKNSEASVGMMQMVNRAYELLEGDLAPSKREKGDQGCYREEPDYLFEQYFEEKRDEENTSTQKNCRMSNRRNETTQKAAIAKESSGDIEKEKKKLSRMKRKIMRDNNRKAKQVNLHTKEGRDKAHQGWVEQLKSMNHHRRASGKRTSAATSPLKGEPTSSTSKPKYLVMEYCNNEIVMALRMGLPEVAIHILQTIIDSNSRISLERGGYTSDSIHKDKNVEHRADHAVTDCLLGAIDDDCNTLLHYAVYFESRELITFLVYLSHRVTNLQDLILKPNRYGEQAVDFSTVISDQFIKTMTEALFLRANEELERTHLIPALKRAHRRLRVMDKSRDLIAFLTTAMSFGVGRSWFGCGYLTSFVTIGLFRRKFGILGGSDADFLAHLLGLHSTWITFWYTIRCVRHLLPSEHVLLAIPIGIFLCGSTPGNTSYLMFTFQMFLHCYRQVIENIMIPKAVSTSGLDCVYLFGLHWTASCTTV